LSNSRSEEDVAIERFQLIAGIVSEEAQNDRWIRSEEIKKAVRASGWSVRTIPRYEKTTYTLAWASKVLSLRTRVGKVLGVFAPKSSMEP
jgi:hypothetical protein